MRGPQGATTVRHPIFRWIFMGLLLLGTLLGSVEATQGGELSHDLSPRVATLAEEIAAARHAETPEFAARMGVPLGDLKEFTNSLLTLRNLYLLFPTELRRRDDAARQLAAWEQNPPAAAPEVPPPYGMAFYDRTWDRRDEIVRRVEEGNFDRRSIRGDLEAQANARDVSRRQLRRIEDRLREVSLPEEERRKLEWQQRRLLLDQEGDNAFVELLNIRDNALRLEGERLSRELALLEERLDVIRNHLEFREEDRHQDMESLGDQAAAMAARGQQYDRRFETFQGAALRARDPGAFPGIAEEQALRELGAEACQRLRDQCRLMEEVLREQQVTRERRYTSQFSPGPASESQAAGHPRAALHLAVISSRRPHPGGVEKGLGKLEILRGLVAAFAAPMAALVGKSHRHPAERDGRPDRRGPTALHGTRNDVPAPGNPGHHPGK